MWFRKFVGLMLGFCLTSGAAGCELDWEWSGLEEWIDGFRVYQGGVEVGATLPTERVKSCESVGLVPGPGAVTMTAFRGPDESPQSEPAVFVLEAPGLVIRITAN